MNRNILIYGLMLLFVFGSGCSRDILDPTQVGRFRPTPVVNVILPSLGVADEPEEVFAGAEDPRPEDVMAYEQDYVLGAGDVVRISIYELLQEGVPYVNDYVVTETGRISLPEIGMVQAAGLSEAKLEEEVKNILSPRILKDPSVTVLVLNSEGRVFSISGAGITGDGGRYPISRHDFRLLDAINMVGGVGQYNVSNIYVSRDVTGQEQTYGAAEEFEALESGDFQLDRIDKGGKRDSVIPEEEMLEIIAPYAKGKAGRGKIIISSAEMVSEHELEDLAAPEGFESVGTRQPEPVIEPEISENASIPNDSERLEWIFEDGKWVPVRVGKAVERVERIKSPEVNGVLPLEQRKPEEYGWGQIGTGGTQRRVIKIPTDGLFGGDARYNIMIRPGDTITVPVDIIGEFHVSGNVNNTGGISLVGRKVTLKQAVLSLAGGLGPLAYPKKVEVIRRLGKDKNGLDREVTVMVDLDKISKGLQPDFYIKPDDLINVGTHGTSRFLAVLRNAFRATYGFGFIYDRNFATRDFGNDPFPGHISFNSLF